MGAIKSLFNDSVISPRSVIKNFKVDKSLFLVTPKDQNGIGWGSPFVDPQGKRLVFGTHGGEGIVKGLSFDTRMNRYRATNNVGWAKFGNTYWVGPKKPNAQNEYDRYIVSWHGPRVRYFQDKNFTYGEDDVQHEVYSNGRVICVAPGPVLAAAIKEESDSLFLYVIYKSGSDDVFVRYTYFSSGFSDSALNDGIREKMQESKSQSNPYGYELLGSFGPITEDHYMIHYETLAPDLPWSFNESCTQAATTRMANVTIDPQENNGVALTEKTKVLLMATIDRAVTITSYGMTSAIQLSYSYRYMQKKPDPSKPDNEQYWNAIGGPPDWNYYWVDNPDQPPIPDNVAGNYVYDHLGNKQVRHYWTYFNMRMRLKLEGKLLVGVDFDKDKLVVINMEYNHNELADQDFTWGVDCDLYYNHPVTYDPNIHRYSGLVQCACKIGSGCNTYDPSVNTGKRMVNNRPASVIADVDDEYPDSWVGDDSFVQIVFENTEGKQAVPLVRNFTGTVYEWEYGHKKNDADIGFEMYAYEQRYVHFIDVRAPHLVSFTELKNTGQVKFDELMEYFEFWGSYNHTIWQKEGINFGGNEMYLTNKTLLTEDIPNSELVGYTNKGEPAIQAIKSPQGGPDFAFSEDVTYDFDNGNGEHLFKVTWFFFSMSIDELLEKKNTDLPKIEPSFGIWYHGVLKRMIVHPPEKYFGGMIKDTWRPDVLIDIASVDGGMAKILDKWVLSYVPPSLIYSQEKIDPINVTDGAAVNGPQSDLSSIISVGDTYYPVGVF